MEPRTPLTGLGTALITPFHPDGSLDEAALHALVHWQIESGVDFLVACGSTGEAATLSEDETHAVVRLIAATASGRVPVFAGCTHNSTAEAVRRVRQICRIPGLTGILTANPYYSKPTQEGQFLHFEAIARAAEDKPVLLYNIPSRTAANLDPATVLRLSEIENIVGLKESSGNLAQISEALAIAPRGFSILSGDDYLALPVLAAGGAGLISVASNVLPSEIARMIQAAMAGDWTKARNAGRHMHALVQGLFLEPNPAPVKAVLRAMGKIGSDHLRLPMTPVSYVTRRRLEAIAGELGLLVNAPHLGGDLRVF